MFRHVAPNLLGPIVVFSTIDLGSTLLTVSGLSFLGFGVGPPTPEWGAMLSEARTFLDKAPQLLAWPGMAITIMVLAFNLAGDGLRDLLDPRTVESTPGWERRLRRRGRRTPPKPGGRMPHRSTSVPTRCRACRRRRSGRQGPVSATSVPKSAAADDCRVLPVGAVVERQTHPIGRAGDGAARAVDREPQLDLGLEGRSARSDIENPHLRRVQLHNRLLWSRAPQEAPVSTESARSAP